MRKLIAFVQKEMKENSGLFQFVKFGITGVVGASFDFSIFALLHSYLGWYYLYANFVSVFVAICVTFTINKFWTFKAGGSEDLRGQTIKFFTVATINYFLQQLLLYLIVTYVPIERLFGVTTEQQINDFGEIKALISKVIAICIVMFSNFFLNKFWTFREEANRPALK